MVLPKFGIAVGKRRGYPTTQRKAVQKVVKKADKKKVKKVTKNTFIRDLCEEVCGYAPYEGRVMELLGNVANTHSAEKRPVNFTKARIGSLSKAKIKVKRIEELKNKIQKRNIEYQRSKEKK
jgi:large subunit ribosomal protein L36e